VVSIKQLADAVGRRPAGKGADSSWVSALMRADNVRRSAAGERPRFRLLGGGRVALFEWGLDRDALATEKAIKDQAERLRVAVRKQLLRKLVELPHKAAAELWMVLLERLGYGQFKVVRRPGAHPSELHWSAVHTSAGGDVPVAIVVRRDGRDLGRERVADLRGSLHHYGAAAFGVLVTTGQVMSGAREEASAPFATPVVFVDGAHAAELCERNGVGVVQHCVALPAIDTEWFEALRSGQ
jgi:restriction endonuclease Mrr